ncbi:lanosterol 14-alpha demethylase [Streptomyces capparidis]
MQPAGDGHAPAATATAEADPPGTADVPMVSGGVPGLGHLPAFVSDPTTVLRSGYTEHGRSFRLNLAGRPAVVVLEPQHWKQMLTQPEATLSIAASYPFLRAMFSEDFYLLTHEAEYQRQRELYLPAFRGKQLQQYVGVMERKTQELIGELGDRGEAELVHLTAALNLKVSAHSFLGEEFGARFGELLEDFQAFSGNVSFLLPTWLRPAQTSRSRAARRKLNRVVHECLVERRARPRPEPDFMQSLSTSRYADGSPVPDEVLVQQALGLVWAGQETTSGQLAWALVDVMTHPEHQAAILAEQAEQLADAEGLTVERLDRLKVLRSVLYESERLRPLAFLLARKAMRPLNLGPHAIARGTMVMTSPYLVHRMAEDFPDPHAFRPERFRENPQSENRLLGFGAGLHRCLGQRFARLETQVVVTMLLRHYTLELLDAPTPTGGLFPRGLKGPCRFRYRRRTAEA